MEWQKGGQLSFLSHTPSLSQARAAAGNDGRKTKGLNGKSNETVEEAS